MNDNVWEEEYKKPQLISLGTEAIQSVKDWVRFLRKDRNMVFSHKNILDLGCGNGKNSISIAEYGVGNVLAGIDISPTAIKYAQALAREKQVTADFRIGSIGSHLLFPDSHFDLALDVTSSNSLNEKEREIYLRETARVLKPQAPFFIRALSKDGDAHAKTLIKTHPGREKDTYIMPALGLTERVFTKEDFEAIYSPFFTILSMEKEIHYTKFNNRSYKRHFWVAYLEKK